MNEFKSKTIQAQYVPKMEKKIQRFKYKEKHPTRGNKEQD
jgi:tRNA U34 5-carboxymethylaminomethyl modifying enzyme MnmG/GidA